MQSYKELEIYRLAHPALGIHRMTMKLPKFEMYEKGAQIRGIRKLDRKLNKFIQSVVTHCTQRINT